jgi:hypothetical protein
MWERGLCLRGEHAARVGLREVLAARPIHEAQQEHCGQALLPRARPKYGRTHQEELVIMQTSERTHQHYTCCICLSSEVKGQEHACEDCRDIFMLPTSEADQAGQARTQIGPTDI